MSDRWAWNGTVKECSSLTWFMTPVLAPGSDRASSISGGWKVIVWPPVRHNNWSLPWLLRGLSDTMSARPWEGKPMTSTEPVHTESETHQWTIDVGDHPTRTDSPEYVAAKNKMNEIATGATALIYGQPPFQDHHGSALWLKDAQGWFLVRNLAGIEWSAQFCADPEKVDLLRQ